MRGICPLIILLSPLACKHYLVEVDKEAEKNQEKGSDYSGTIYDYTSSWWFVKNCKVQIKMKCRGEGGNQSQCSL